MWARYSADVLPITRLWPSNCSLLFKGSCLLMTRCNYGRAYQSGFTLTLRFLISRGAPLDSAEEAAQAAWTRGWEQITQLRDEGLLITWINTIALNLWRRASYLERRKQTLLDRAGGAEVNVAAIDLKRILASCRPSDRTLLIHQLHGLTTREIAHEVGATETAVRIRLTRARRSVTTIGRLPRAA